MPAHKKAPGTRRRRNTASTAATLPARSLAAVPDAVDYSSLSIAQLRDEIDLRNEDRPADEHLSKRGTKAALVETLHADDAAELAYDIPDLPAHPPMWTDDGERVDLDWHAQTLAWWNDVWSSPMSAEWDESDVHNLFLCALLHDDMWTASTAKARKEAAGEFRLQRAALGLDPYARRRLEWQIEATGEAQDKGQKRRQRQGEKPAPQPDAGPKPDPRGAFSVVN